MQSMEQENKTAEAPEVQAGVQEFVRPLEGRVLAGVSQGLANRFNLPVWVPRALFVVLAFFGGLGLALYAGGWALTRSEDETESPAERFFSGASTTRSWIGIALIFVAALILLDNFTFFSGGVVFAAGVLIVGVLLYAGQIPLPGRGQDKQKEGVQQMTMTETNTDESSGDSPAGGGVPPTPTPTPPILPPEAKQPKERSILGRLTIGFMLLGLGVLAVLDAISDVAIDAEPRHYMALAVTILGIGLLVGTFAGRARWLVLVAVILVPTLLISVGFEYDWSFNSDTFDVSVEPQTFAEVEDVYSVDVGNLMIDLSDLPWDGQTIHLSARVDLGNLEIRIPREVGIVGEASVDIGRVATTGRTSSGLGSPHLSFNETGTDGTVFLDASVDVGNIEIRR